MLINELSKRTGVSIHTLRYYENLGLFKGVTDKEVETNNYRNYDESHVEKVEMIKEIKEVGFTLSEIKTILDNWYSGTLPMEAQLELVDVKIKEVDAKINQLKSVKKRMYQMKKEIAQGECQSG